MRAAGLDLPLATRLVKDLGVREEGDLGLLTPEMWGKLVGPALTPIQAAKLERLVKRMASFSKWVPF